MKWIIGIDEVGRGPLAGPVYVCAVAIPGNIYKEIGWGILTDSKKMTPRDREAWYAKALEMERNGMIRIALSRKSAYMIDKIRISRCIRSCIGEILQKLAIDPGEAHVFLDGGLKAPKAYVSQETIIRGDAKEKAISLASVVAKVKRDAHMRSLSKKYEVYSWDTNKGYGTKTHILSLKKHGLTPLHRKTYLARVLDN